MRRVPYEGTVLGFRTDAGYYDLPFRVHNCPHVCVGFHTTGSPDVETEGLGTARVGDYGSHTCPHCGVNMNVAGSPTVGANDIPVVRVGDPVTEFCGCGVCVTGSQTVVTDEG